MVSARSLSLPLAWNSAGPRGVGKNTKWNWKNVELLQRTWKTFTRFIWLWKKTYPENSDRRNYFLATCSQFFFSSKEDINYDIAVKLRPYGGLIGIDNFSLDKYLNDSKILRLHAILPDAAGFVHEVYNTGPTYCYMLPWKRNNSLIGHLSGITFCLYVKLTKQCLYQLLERWRKDQSC